MWSRVSGAAALGRRRLPGPGSGPGPGPGVTLGLCWRTGPRGLSDKPQDSKLVPEPGRPPGPGPGPERGAGGGGGGERPAYRLPGFAPSVMDKRLLLWAGRFKREGDIPAMVSFEMIDAARNKVRVKACYAMVFLSVLACIGTVIAGKKAAGRHESLTAMNMRKKARWKEEAERESEASKKQ